jgi:uncharacterized protein (DUF302 family)
VASKKRGITSGRVDAYEALRAQGMSKKKAAKIANAGKTKAGRSAMAKKAARTRGRRGR